MARSLRIPVDEKYGEVSGLLERPANAHSLLLLAHGAGADMHHAFMEAISAALARRAVATLRYQFPYSEAGQRRPSPRKALLATAAAAAAAARKHARGLPLLAGGKSMGGRMTSLFAAEARAANEPGLQDFSGIVFLGFPLHAAGKPFSRDRVEHLADVTHPMLFLQGTRDALSPQDEIERVCREHGAAARLHLVDGGDHGFHVLKRSGRSDEEVLDELADAIDVFARDVAPRG